MQHREQSVMQKSITAAGFHRMQPEATKATNDGVHKDTSKAGLLSVDQFGFTRAQYFGIISFAR